MAAGIQIVIPAVQIELKSKEITRALRGAGRLLAATARSLIESSAGTPGGPPKSRTGVLASSIRSSAKKSFVRVVSNAAYSTALEAGATGGGGIKGQKSLFGVKGRGRTRRGIAQTARVMPAYPFMNPALDQKRSEIERRVTTAVMQDIEFKVAK